MQKISSIGAAVSIQYRRMTDTDTDTRRQHLPHYQWSRGKNHDISATVVPIWMKCGMLTAIGR